MQYHQKKQSDRTVIWMPAKGRLLSGLLIALMLQVLTTGLLNAENLVVKKDVDQDGRIDQTAYLDDEGRLTKLQIDTNQDGFENVYQIYAQGALIRIERDTDFDRVLDTRDWFKEGLPFLPRKQRKSL